MRFLAVLKQSVMQRSRSKKLDEFYAICNSSCKVLDVGVSDNDHSPQVNLFLKTFRYPDQYYTGLAVQPMTEVAKAHPGKRFVVYGGGRFPFPNRSFDCAFSNAVIEHVGDSKAQLEFIDEMLRCASKVYFTTPSKYFPIESHTNVIFMHWLPRLFFRWCRKYSPYWSESNLRLLSYRDLNELMKRSTASSFEIRRNRLLGMTMTFSVVCRGAEMTPPFHQKQFDAHNDSCSAATEHSIR